ncbi:hypothetical protein [Arenimonas sp.]|uniref:hypothetical protein n=1 Tax=Arenimonas sp. TaxID=1872635 RepID=UPI0039E4CAF5
MKNILALTLAASACLLTGASGAHGTLGAKVPEAEVEKRLCENAPCQRNLRVSLKKKDGSVYENTFPVFPAAIQSFGITVVAGQTLHVEADLVEGKLANMRVVETVLHPEKTLTATFTQHEDGGMLLALSNPFDQTIRFRMGIMPLDAEQLYATSSCPIGAHQSSYEMWPYPIFQVILGDGQVIGKDDSLACVE